LFDVDTTATVASCGIVAVSLTTDTSGTAFVSEYSNNFITLNSDNSLILPTSRRLDEIAFYVRAVTNGNKVAYKQIKVQITECGSEVLTSKFPYYWNITVPYKSGLYKTEVLSNKFLETMFSSTVSY